MIETVKEFIKNNELSRFDKILKLLNDNNIEYEIKEYLFDSVKNIVIKLGKFTSEKILVLGAHYDAVKYSLGINDNLCSIIMLIELIKVVKHNSLDIPIEVVFFDKEESGMLGSNYYVRDNKDRIDSAIIFDIIAYGNTLVYWTNSILADRLLRKKDIKKLKEMLISDNAVFYREGVDVTLITAAHNEDMIQRDDEYILIPYPEFYTSFHNRKNDNNIEVLNFDLPNKLLDILYNILSGMQI